MIDQAIKEKILSITSVFETGKVSGNYSALAILSDGPGGRLQVTFGKHQTTEYGNLKILLNDYVKARGKYSALIAPYLSSIGITPLYKNGPFINLLKRSGDDPVMHVVQDEFFDTNYYDPAYEFFVGNGFVLPLSMAVIYDSYIHSGGIPVWLRKKFSERTPSRGGSEKEWIKEYVTTRDNWLEHNSRKVLRNTDYRTDCWLEQIANNNWDLLQPVICKFNSALQKNWVTIT